jgi:hypothetical protein
MNLHSIVAPVIAAVNPMVPCSVQISNGNVNSADYTPIPSYKPAVIIQGQVQSLTFRDIQQLDGLNLQGTRRAIYLLGDVEGLVRPDNKGGDLITLPDGTIWLVAMVLESWLQNNDATAPGWVKVAVTLQNGS